MREIIFRAWFDRGEDGVESLASHGNNPADQFRWIEEGQPIILEQFTGLHDKNGKEIYEGDIVKARTNHFPRVNLEGVIVFEDAEYLIEQKDGSFPLCSFHVVDRLTIEIIGNIHSNPELLK